MAGLLTQRRQLLRIAIPDDLPQITGDAPRLTQVVTNLLANASKFGPEDSEISVGAASRSDGQVELWVEDAGPGAPELEGTVDLRALLSLRRSSEPDPRGLGLGLWIVKSIVERHGGEVRRGAARRQAARASPSRLPIAAAAA